MTFIKSQVSTVFCFLLGLGMTVSGLAFAEGLGQKEELDTCTGESNLTQKTPDAQTEVQSKEAQPPAADGAG